MLEIEETGKALVVKVKLPKLDMQRAAEFKQALAAALSGHGEPALLDLGDVAFIDSSGLAALIYCFNLTDISNELIICCAQERVKELLRITKMIDVVRVFETREEALNTL